MSQEEETAKDRLVIGPLMTAGGFKCWFWACCPDRIVAVPGGFWVAIQAGMMGMGAFGAIGGALAGISAVKGGKQAGSLANKMVTISDEKLNTLPGAMVHAWEDLDYIGYKRVAIGQPEIILNPKEGKKWVHGVSNPLTFDTIVKALQDEYGERVKKQEKK